VRTSLADPLTIKSPTEYDAALDVDDRLAAVLSKPLPDWNAMEIPLNGLPIEGVDVR
jgi:hypothetical protein